MSTPSWLDAAVDLDAPAADRVPLTPSPVEAKPRPHVAAPPVVVPDAAAGEEVEVAWHGYATATLLPGTVALAALTAAVVVSLRPRMPAAFVHEAIDAPLAAVWLFQAVRVAYRVVAYQYRLTTRRLFRNRGPLYPPDEPLNLAAVVRVDVVGALLGIGTVRVWSEESAGRPPLELPGVRRPKAMAAVIEQTAAAAREGAVASGRGASDVAVTRRDDNAGGRLGVAEGVVVLQRDVQEPTHVR